MSSVQNLGRSKLVELARFRELAESLDQSLVLIAADLSQVFYVSPTYERLTGFTCESLYENPRAWVESIYEEDRRGVLEIVAKRISGELLRRSDLEYRIRTASGETRWLRSVITPAFDAAGQADCLVELAEDITKHKQADLKLRADQEQLAREVQLRSDDLAQTVTRLQQEIEQRKQIEKDLRRSETRFRRLFEVNIIGVLFSDIYGNVIDANEAFLKMTGYSRADLPLRWDNMTPREWSHASELAVQQLVREGTVPPLEKEYIRKDGTRVPVLIGSALLDRDTWQCVTFVIDLTGRKAAEEQVREVNLQLEHASRLSVMGEMLADLAHEIHQPIGAIANNASGSLLRLKQGELTVDALEERLREISTESMRVASVVRSIREFIRLREPERQLVDINLTVMDALQLTRLERREHRVAVILRPDGNLPLALADRVQITQVLLNLFSNAIYAVSAARCESPKLLVSTYVNAAGFLEISVADNGAGIAAENLPKIFKRFFTTKSSGLGLGLPISLSIIESHGGNLWCDSVPGESTVFRFTLPAQAPATVS
ncbi:MAG TPA: PAS domain S-box protein [Planctomycetaceae bacterium]|jgi:PAS domain S-box-containing protein|nr:PAS domain S-box protein [Planctomycetaceae bacterium]